ncbi:hypothetical protein [Roseiconus lacunae]|uniref:hypothetical protein n=1 Tax=Roseiconus lacunae TaxID=2605694 RepID=UPI001E4A7144|nr:hypothetical protein [Roseiconus lacunae]MCD0459212.1 hypothetical protein [Roseiconus lacunae]
MMQQTLFDGGLAVCSMFIGQTVELSAPSDRLRAAQLALLRVLLKRRSGKASADDIVRDSSKAYPDGGRWLGGAIRQLAEDGLIRCCGAKRSKRTSRHSGLLCEWELVDRRKARQKVKRLELGLRFVKESDSTAATAEPGDSQTHQGSKERTDG